MPDLNLTFADSVATLRLDAPARRNAMSRDMWAALPEICARVEESAVHALVVKGEGAHFCAGADISEFEQLYRDQAAVQETSDVIRAGLAALAALDRPVIAAIRGNCIGGGLAIAMACDLRFCADDAFLAITPAKLGLLYGFTESKRLVDLVGPARAKDILFSGRRIRVEEALNIGLVDRVMPAAELNSAVAAYLGELAPLSQRSIRAAKCAIDRINAGLQAEDFAFRQVLVDVALGPDFIEGRAAFLAKRPPRFPFARK